MKSRIHVCLAIGCALSVHSFSSASTLFGSKNSTNFGFDGIYYIDQTNGALTKLGGDNVAWGNMTSDWRPGAEGLWVAQPNQNKIFRVNPGTGSHVLEKEDIFMPPDIAFDITTGKMYGDRLDRLYDINLGAPGVIELVAFSRPIRAMVFNSAGVLYATDNNGNLVTVNKTTGAVTTVGPTGVADMHDLAFRPEDGALFGSGSTANSSIEAIYRLDPATGTSTVVGTYPTPNSPFFVVRGIAFSTVPEPTGFLTPCTLMLILGRWRVRRRT